MPIIKLTDTKHLLGLFADNNFKAMIKADDELPYLLPDKKVMIEALNRLPAIEDNEIKELWKIITGEEYEHFDYCFAVGLALYNYSFLSGNEALLLSEYIGWLAQDEDNFDGEDDITNAWISLGDGESRVSYKILLALGHVDQFEYPKPFADRDGWLYKERPLTNEYANFKYILRYYDIHFYQDSNGYYLTGKYDYTMHKYFGPYCGKILNKYYGPLNVKTLHLAFLALLQDCGWRCSTVKTLIDIKIQQKLPVFSLFKVWLDTPFDDLPDEYKHITIGNKLVNVKDFDDVSTVDHLFDCIETTYTEKKELRLAKNMFRKTLMHMMSFIEPAASHFIENSGMFLLIGAEDADKSAFFQLLLPPPLAHLRKEISIQPGIDKMLRDLPEALSSSVMVQLDEFEVLMNHRKYGPMFKTMLASDSAGMHRTQENLYERSAVIVGAGNELRQCISADNSRHMWIVQVKKIDTGRMRKINLHTLYNNIRGEFRKELKSGIIPWLLDEKDLNLLKEMNEAATAENDLLSVPCLVPDDVMKRQ